MRILIATDGSEPADRAIRAVASLRWGDDTLVRLLEVVPDQVDVFGMALEEVTQATIEAEMEGTLRRSMRALGPLEAHAQRAVVRGRPANAILAEAEQFGADLIVLGHRGRGAVAARLIGSVASEVAESATRPVLVVRGEIRGRPVLLADDGSPPARAARRIVADWPLFERGEIRVVSIADVTAPLSSGIAITVRRQAAVAQREEVARSLSEAARVAGRSEAELREAHRDASVSVALGDPPTEILGLAKALAAGLIVVGCRGHGPVASLMGTTARTVVLGAPCSVLVVHAAGPNAAGG